MLGQLSVAETGPSHEESSVTPKSLNFILKMTGNRFMILFSSGNDVITFPFQKVHLGGLFRKESTLDGKTSLKQWAPKVVRNDQFQFGEHQVG